jgi:hypothetical protein
MKSYRYLGAIFWALAITAPLAAQYAPPAATYSVQNVSATDSNGESQAVSQSTTSGISPSSLQAVAGAGSATAAFDVGGAGPSMVNTSQFAAESIYTSTSTALAYTILTIYFTVVSPSGVAAINVPVMASGSVQLGQVTDSLGQSEAQIFLASSPGGATQGMASYSCQPSDMAGCGDNIYQITGTFQAFTDAALAGSTSYSGVIIITNLTSAQGAIYICTTASSGVCEAAASATAATSAPFLYIDPTWLASNPGYSIVFSPVVTNARLSQSITFAAIPTQKVGTNVPLTASADSGLAVSFASTTPGVCSVAGTVATLLAMGTCTIEAMQAGSVIYAPASPVSQSFTVTGLDDLGFIPITPCRVVDTRAAVGSLGGPSMTAGSTRSFPLPMGACGLPAEASAYSLNVTVAPKTKLQYLSLWASGQAQPFVSTLNSLDGRIVANAAIVAAGTDGAISVYVTDATDVIIDVNGYFGPNSASGALTFVPVTPCRVTDTRKATGTFGGPVLTAGSSRSFPVPSSACSIPATATAYALNATAIPTSTLRYLTLYPTGSVLPYVSTLNSYNGQVTANAAIVPMGTNGGVTAYVTDQANLVLDINGYFTSNPPAPRVFNTVTPCRVADTRNASGTFGGPIMAANSTRSFPLPASACNIPSSATAYALNITVVPTGELQYLTLWPDGQAKPAVSTLNSYDGQVVANAALVQGGNAGAVDVYVTDQTHVVIDIVGYFSAPE